jgi:monoterpene epsilon-lactone hydrolase
VLEVVMADRDIQEMRAAYESFLAQTAVPESVTVRPVNAGGVSSLELSAGGEPGAAVLYFHGGGYMLGSAYGYRPLVGALVAAAGVGALVPDFRLAPEHPFPAALEDALSAYRWLLEQRGGGGIVLAGDSAGAGLACSLLLTLRAQELPQAAGAAFLCPGVDPTGDAILSSSGGVASEELERIHRTVEVYLAGHPIDDPVVNPLVADLSGLPPLLIQTATGDLVLAESRLLADRATEHGVDARLELYAADTHVFHVFWSFLPEAADALQQAGVFIRAQLAAGRAERTA